MTTSITTMISSDIIRRRFRLEINIENKSAKAVILKAIKRKHSIIHSKQHHAQRVAEMILDQNPVVESIIIYEDVSRIVAASDRGASFSLHGGVDKNALLSYTGPRN